MSDPNTSFLWLQSGGEMGRLVTSFDWSKTPLGPIAHWPLSLTTAVRLMLSSRYPMFVWWGEELTILYNDGYAPIFGAKHPTALGRPARQVWSEIWPDLAPQVEAVMREARASWNEEVLLMMERYGFPEETYFTWSYSPIWNEAGNVGGLFCACTEETTRVLGRRRLKTLRELAERSLAKARTAEQVCQAAAATLQENPQDFSFAVLYLNDESGERARLVETVNLPADSNIPREVILGAGSDLWGFKAAAEGGQSRVIENLQRRFARFSGARWPEQATGRAAIMPLARTGRELLPAGFLVAGISPRQAFTGEYRSFFDLAAGQIATALASARAYEEERKRAEALAELDRAKTAFFSNVSHEFRTPLTLMLGPLEELLAHFEGGTSGISPAEFEQVTMVYRNGLRLLKLVNTLLDFARIEAGRIQAHFQPIDLAAWTVELASAFRSAIENAGLRFVVDCPPLPQPVFADRQMWEKIVLNLLSNAFKFTFEGEIALSLGWCGDRVELTVRDTGVGIPANDLPRVFERFHRVPHTRARTHEGTGIGLALVQELARLHGGSAKVESEPGRGTTFTVSIRTGADHLPLEQVSHAPAVRSTAVGISPFLEEAVRWLPDPAPLALAGSVAPRTEISPPDAHRGARILLADDNADMREYLRRLLAQRDFQVFTAADGEAALAAVRARPPQLVLTDVMMPRMDGLGLLRALRAEPGLREIPVVLLSARAAEEARLEALEHGADDYIVKPFSARELLARIDSQLKIARWRRQAEEAIRTSAERLRLATEAAEMFAWDCDVATRSIFWSENTAAVLGCPAEELPVDMREAHFFVAPQESGRVLSEFEAAVAQRRERYSAEFRGRGNSRFYFAQARVYYNELGAPVRVIGITQDITERKQSEQALRESEARFRTMADSSPVMVWVTDARGACTYLNRRWFAFTGQTEAEALGVGWLKAVHPDDRQKSEAIFLRVLERQESFQLEYRLRRYDGQYRWAIDAAAPRFDTDGAFQGYVGSVVDIDDQKRVEEMLEATVTERTAQLSAMNEQLEAFIYSIAHDLRAPLRSMTGFSQILMEDFAPALGDSGAGLLQRIRDSGEMMDKLLLDLLAYGRAARMEIRPEAVKVSDAWASALNQCAREIEQSGVLIDTASDLPAVLAHEPILAQCLANLLANAIKFVAEGTRPVVRLWSEEREGQVRLWLEDNGVGIPTGQHERVFRLFERLHGARFSGTGIGLSIVRKGVERMGGHVGLESEEDKGSRFWIQLPKA